MWTYEETGQSPQNGHKNGNQKKENSEKARSLDWFKGSYLRSLQKQSDQLDKDPQGKSDQGRHTDKNTIK